MIFANCFSNNAVDVFVPPKVLCNRKIKLIYVVDMLELMTMHGIREDLWITLAGGGDDFTFLWMKLHYSIWFSRLVTLLIIILKSSNIIISRSSQSCSKETVA